MQIYFSKLWKLLENKKISRGALRQEAGLSSSTYSKLVNNKNVSTLTLVRICNYLECDLSDIAEVK